MAKKEWRVLSVGGSLIVPEEIDTHFIKLFVGLVKDLARKYNLALVIGGGRTARRYISAAGVLGEIHEEHKDWLGIYSTRINAHMILNALHGVAHPSLLTNPSVVPQTKRSVLVFAGWKPVVRGASTDYDAVLVARTLGARAVYNLTDVDYVYDKNPKKYKNALPYKMMTWKEFFTLDTTSWKEGHHLPFDVAAAQLARKLGIAVVVLNGKKMERVKKTLMGKTILGTVIA